MLKKTRSPAAERNPIISATLITKKIKYIAFQNIAFDYSAGKNISKNLIKSAAFFISGVLFFIPGFISDFLAVLFLIPFLNYYIIYLIFKYFIKKLHNGVNFTYYYSNAHSKYSGQTMDEDRNENADGENENSSGRNKIVNVLSLPLKKYNDK